VTAEPEALKPEQQSNPVDPVPQAKEEPDDDEVNIKTEAAPSFEQQQGYGDMQGIQGMEQQQNGGFGGGMEHHSVEHERPARISEDG